MPKLSSKVVVFHFLFLCWGLVLNVIAGDGGGETRPGELKDPNHQKVAAEVNGQPIFLSKLQEELKKAELRLGHREFSLKRKEEIQKELLESIIARELILQEAKKEKIDPDLLVKKEIYEKTVSSEEEVKAYYRNHPDEFMRPEGVRLRHLLVRVDPSSSNEGWKAGYRKALEFSKRANQGEDFETLVQRYSDPEARYFGGDLQIQYKGQMTMSEFERAGFSLKEKEVSLPIQTLYGFSLIQIVEKIPQKPFSFSEINQEMLKKKVSQEKEIRISESWIRALRSQATIKYYQE